MKTEQQFSLTKAVLISLLVAVAALVLFILPAEYNLDPTGIGKRLGLTVFNGETEQSTVVQEQGNAKGESFSVVLTVPAGRGIEYKLAMQQHQKVSYQWQSASDELYVDLHGEPEGDTTGYFESYAIATVTDMKGAFIAPFDGSHGWYWRNSSEQDVQLQLIFNGEYVIEGLKQ